MINKFEISKIMDSREQYFTISDLCYKVPTPLHMDTLNEIYFVGRLVESIVGAD